MDTRFELQFSILASLEKKNTYFYLITITLFVLSLAHQRDKRGMCQVCANQGNITKEVKVEVISRKGSVTSFSRYIRSLYMYLTQTCTVIHVGTCTLSLIIMEQDSVKVRGHNKLLPLPERVVSLSLFLFIPLFFCKLDPFLKVSQYFC